MNDNRFDLGRPAGPDFLPPGEAGSPGRGPAAPVPIRIDVKAPDVMTPRPPEPVGEPVRTGRGRTSTVLVAALLVGGIAGAATGVLTTNADRSSIMQYQADPRGFGGLPD